MLDHRGLKDVTLIGLSMGEYFALRAAAFESRVKRVIASGHAFDYRKVARAPATAILVFFHDHLREFTNRLSKWTIRKNGMEAWNISHLMYVLDVDEPMAGLESALQLSEENLHSDLVKQDVLLLASRDDHVVWFWIGSHAEYDKRLGRKPADKAQHPTRQVRRSAKADGDLARRRTSAGKPISQTARTARTGRAARQHSSRPRSAHAANRGRSEPAFEPSRHRPHSKRIGCILRDRCRSWEADQWGKRAAHYFGRVGAGERVLHVLDAAPSRGHRVSAAHPCGWPGRIHWRSGVPRSRARMRLGEPSLLAPWLVMRSRARRQAAP